MSLCHTIRNFLKRNQNIFLKRLCYFCLISMCFVFAANAFSQEPSQVDEEPSLAEKVFEKYHTLLLREDIQALLPTILEEIKKPDNQKLLVPETIKVVVDNPDLLKTFIPGIDDEFITLLKEDQEIRAYLMDADVQTLLQDPEAIDELAALIEMSQLPLAVRIFERYQEFFQREDIMQLLPDVLSEFKNPENQALLQPNTLTLAVENPDHLKEVLPQLKDEFITLLKTDAEVKALINDPNVQVLLRDPTAIDELASLLNTKAIVRIVPASFESPQVGEQLVITVDIANGFGVAGYQGIVTFDSTALRHVSLAHGSYFSGRLITVPTAVEENQVSFAQTALETTASTAAGTLVTITFEVLDTKASILTLSDVIIAGFGGVSFPIKIENSEILEPPPPPRPWDTNRDGKVNILDLTFVASHFGKADAPTAADVNGDGKVNILDLTLVASHFGESY